MTFSANGQEIYMQILFFNQSLLLTLDLIKSPTITHPFGRPSTHPVPKWNPWYEQYSQFEKMILDSDLIFPSFDIWFNCCKDEPNSCRDALESCVTHKAHVRGHISFAEEESYSSFDLPFSGGIVFQLIRSLLQFNPFSSIVRPRRTRKTHKWCPKLKSFCLVAVLRSDWSSGTGSGSCCLHVLIKHVLQWDGTLQKQQQL